MSGHIRYAIRVLNDIPLDSVDKEASRKINKVIVELAEGLSKVKELEEEVKKR